MKKTISSCTVSSDDVDLNKILHTNNSQFKIPFVALLIDCFYLFSEWCALFLLFPYLFHLAVFLGALFGTKPLAHSR
jgi:hypothetical protein